jgi:glc operon protein GlcG
MKKVGKLILGAIALSLVPAGAQTTSKQTLTLEGAKKAIAAAVADARAKNAPGGVIAVVDDGGNLMALERLDNTFAAGANISIGKARTSALFKRPTKFFEDIIKNGRTSMVALPDSLFTPLQGGIPIEVDGKIVGAIGVSGAATAQQDEELAMAGAAALKTTSMAPSGAQSGMMSSSPAVTYLDRDKVSAAFRKGMPLLEVPGYKVHASRRDAAGMAEVHERDTDIIYVLDGTAELVTGGAVLESKTVAPEEIRGAAISNGDSRRIARGDVIVVPNGTPHWFKQVNAPFTYYVVKVTEAR